jgi:hypothetical protein
VASAHPFVHSTLAQFHELRATRSLNKNSPLKANHARSSHLSVKKGLPRAFRTHPLKIQKPPPGSTAWLKIGRFLLSLLRASQKKRPFGILSTFDWDQRDAAARTPRSLGVKTLGVYCNLFSPLRCMLTNKQTCERERDKVVN